MILESGPADPNVKRKPRNTDTPLNTGESLPGKNGNIRMNQKASNRILMI
jgi:hypothetical protein